MFDNLWIEKYRPTKLVDIILSDSNRRVLTKFDEQKEIPNLLFVGHAGIGKTSLAKLLCKDVLQCQYLYINASDENGIDTIRTKVTNFARTKSFDGKIKCIILDETDGLSLDAQRALRNTMEEHSSITRFILTANYKHRIIPPLLSRCQSLDLTPPPDLCIDRIKKILELEQIEVSEFEKLHTYVKTCLPDLRRCINEIQKNTHQGKLFLNELVKVKDAFVESLYNITRQGLAIKARKKVIENEHVFGGDYNELLRSLFNYVDEAPGVNDLKKSEHMLIVSEHIYRSAFVADPEINFYSCLLTLSTNK
jgi:DNA polymerase III delta prime subunit